MGGVCALSGSLLPQCPLPHDKRLDSSLWELASTQHHQNRLSGSYGLWSFWAFPSLLVNWELPGLWRGSRKGQGWHWLYVLGHNSNWSQFSEEKEQDCLASAGGVERDPEIRLVVREATRRYENDLVRKSKPAMEYRPASPPKKVPSLNRVLRRESPQPEPVWHLSTKRPASHFCSEGRGAWLSLSGPSEVHLSNSASKLPKFIFKKKEKNSPPPQYYQSLDFSVYF